MYKVLIADDEEIIRNGLARLIQKDEEIEVAALAEDGREALQLAERHHPDLVLMDINMPFLNGLDCIEQMREILRDGVIIVITGYDEFAYAQKAVRLGVRDYLLKPVSTKLFFETVNKAKQELREKRERSDYLQWARQQIEKEKQVLRNDFLQDCLEGRLDSEEIRNKGKYLDIVMPEPVGLTLVRIIPDETRMKVSEHWDDTLLYYGAENIALELLSKHETAFSCRDTGGEMVLFSDLPCEETWKEEGEQIRTVLCRSLPVNVLVEQIGAARTDKLSDCYLQIREQLQRQSNCSQIVLQARQYIEQHYSCEELSLAGLASTLHVSSEHLSRQFRSGMGVTFGEYLTGVRIRKALQLLLQSDLKMYEVAERCGYGSQHYFSNAFKKMIGISPAEYRKNNQG